MLAKELRTCGFIWNRILLEVFGRAAKPHVDDFGRYIILRQQNFYKHFKSSHESENRNKIFDAQSTVLLKHNFYKARLEQF